MSGRRGRRHSIVRVERTGSYPNVWWEHYLSCGHLERRKRKAPGASMVCSQCGAAGEPVVVFDPAAAVLDYEARVAGAVADRLGVEVESVSVEAYLDGGVQKVGRVSVDFFSNADYLIFS